MTEHDVAHSTEHTPASTQGNLVEAMPIKELFNRQEIAQFDADDVTAGSHIGKMLAFFFLYTVIVMGIVAWWTYLSTTR